MYVKLQLNKNLKTNWRVRILFKITVLHKNTTCLSKKIYMIHRQVIVSFYLYIFFKVSRMILNHKWYFYPYNQMMYLLGLKWPQIELFKHGDVN